MNFNLYSVYLIFFFSLDLIYLFFPCVAAKNCVLGERFEVIILCCVVNYVLGVSFEVIVLCCVVL